MRKPDVEFVAGLAAMLCIGANRNAKQAVELVRAIIEEVIKTEPPKEPGNGE